MTGPTPHTSAPDLTKGDAAPSRIIESARRRLRQSAYPLLGRVSCHYDDGVLTLGGRLPTFYLKQIAQTLVATIEGVKLVQNRVNVGGENDR